MATYKVDSPLAGQYFIELNFSFIDKTHVKVKRKLNGESTYTNLTYNDYTQWNNNLANGLPVNSIVYRVVLGNEIGLGNTLYYVQFSRTYDPQATYIVYRATPVYSPAFVNGSALTAEDLNSAFLHLSYQAEEKDQIGISEATINLDGKFDKVGGTISGATTINANLSMGGNRIENVATPVSANQVATKAYVDLANSPGGVPTILPNSITSTELSKVAGSEAVITTAIQDKAVTTSKIADLSVTGSQIADGSITTAKLASGLSIAFNQNAIRCASDGTANPLYESTTTSTTNSLNLQRPVTTNAIRALAITTAKIADLNVTNGKLATDAVTTDKIVNLNVTGAKIADSTITSSKLLTSGLSFTSSGNLTAQATSVASLTSTGNISAPSWQNLKLTNTWSSIDPNNSYLNGFQIYFRPAVTNNAYDVTQPPLTYIKSLESYPEKIILSFENLYRTLGTSLTYDAWTNVKLNRILFNNTSFFNLGSDGTLTIDFSNSASWGTYSIDGWCEAYNQSASIYLTSRIIGAGSQRVATSATTFVEEYSDTATLCYGSLEQQTASFNNKCRSLINGTITASNTPFKFQYYVHSSNNTSNTQFSPNPAVDSNADSEWIRTTTSAYRGKGPLSEYDVTPSGGATGRRFYGNFAYLTITKIS